MRYLKQFAIILAVTCVGELLNYFLPLPIPASIYGLVLMLVLLVTGVVKLESVDETGTFLVEIMPVMFIPAGVGLMTSFGTLKSMLVPVLVITVSVTFLVMAVTGKVTDFVLNHMPAKKADGTVSGNKAGEDVFSSKAGTSGAGDSKTGISEICTPKTGSTSDSNKKEEE
ncbi:MAG: CidA/LrgA family protein [Eubacterium sp.]|nr:CidA/LrgA family protein [Eubacterium sp.]